MLTLITNLLSFLMGGLPKLLEFFQDRADKKHELELARMQTERELEMRKAGFEAQARVEEIKTEQLQIQADSASQQFALQERQADRKSTRLNSSHVSESRMPSSA